ncbi:MAG: hypothetical protein HKN70_11945, partial [Gammaproteobacteria bacterium]|nr:hypothetical protein [Gammaproteobacteria bacterium]
MPEPDFCQLTHQGTTRAMACNANRRLAVFTAILTACLLIHSAGVRADTFRPASFVGGVSAIEGVIKLPEFGGEHVMTVSCYGIVNPSGEMSSQYCHTPTGSGIIGDAIYKLGNKITLTPALKNDKAVTVWIPFTVTFIQKNGQRSLKIYPYHSRRDVAFEPLGSGYSAPQWLPRKHDWSRGCRTRKIVAWLSMKVTEQGIPRNVKKLKKIHPGYCASPIIRYVRNSKFIPAFAHGVP